MLQIHFDKTNLFGLLGLLAQVSPAQLYAQNDYFPVTLSYGVRWMTILWNFPDPDKSAAPVEAASSLLLDKIFKTANQRRRLSCTYM